MLEKISEMKAGKSQKLENNKMNVMNEVRRS